MKSLPESPRIKTDMPSLPTRERGLKYSSSGSASRYSGRSLHGSVD
ncbi:hypothetical protein [Caproicibacterium sp. XB2]